MGQNVAVFFNQIKPDIGVQLTPTFFVPMQDGQLVRNNWKSLNNYRYNTKVFFFFSQNVYINVQLHKIPALVLFFNNKTLASEKQTYMQCI